MKAGHAAWPGQKSVCCVACKKLTVDLMADNTAHRRAAHGAQATAVGQD